MSPHVSCCHCKSDHHFNCAMADKSDVSPAFSCICDSFWKVWLSRLFNPFSEKREKLQTVFAFRITPTMWCSMKTKQFKSQFCWWHDCISQQFDRFEQILLDLPLHFFSIHFKDAFFFLESLQCATMVRCRSTWWNMRQQWDNMNDRSFFDAHSTICHVVGVSWWDSNVVWQRSTPCFNKTVHHWWMPRKSAPF